MKMNKIIGLVFVLLLVIGCERPGIVILYDGDWNQIEEIEFIHMRDEIWVPYVTIVKADSSVIKLMGANYIIKLDNDQALFSK